MFIAMNRFKVRKGAERDFEQVWLSRETHLENVPGFLVFHLLKGPERDDHVLYASHSLWRSEKHFADWTRSEAFRKAHESAGRVCIDRVVALRDRGNDNDSRYVWSAPSPFLPQSP